MPEAILAFGQIRLSESAIICNVYPRTGYGGFTIAICSGTLNSSNGGPYFEPEVHVMFGSPENTNVVVCPELSVASWRQILCTLQSSPDFVAMRCTALPAEVASLCRQLGSALLVADCPLIESFSSRDLNELAVVGRTKILVLVDHIDPTVYENFLSAGCAGVLLSSSPVEVYLKCLNTISKGQLWAPRDLLSKLVHNFLGGDWQARLTIRETEILDLLVDDRTNQDIADRLCLSRETIRWHLRNLYAKLGARNREEAVQYANSKAQLGYRAAERTHL